jgi:LysR family glycine cleavage system transcriptional activator
VAIRYRPLGSDAAQGDKLNDYEVFPVCSPALAADPAHPIRSLADLAHHVLLDLETMANSRPWYDWQHWLDAMRLRDLQSAGQLRFSHYDHVIEAAIHGSGVAIGKLPHLTRQLQRGELVAPLGTPSTARLGSFHIVVAAGANRAAADAFVAWLKAEAQHDAIARQEAIG